MGDQLKIVLKHSKSIGPFAEQSLDRVNMLHDGKIDPFQGTVRNFGFMLKSMLDEEICLCGKRHLIKLSRLFLEVKVGGESTGSLIHVL